jgi:hypothetical protein
MSAAETTTIAVPCLGVIGSRLAPNLASAGHSVIT